MDEVGELDDALEVPETMGYFYRDSSLKL
jgi:hypothetical protein